MSDALDSSHDESSALSEDDATVFTASDSGNGTPDLAGSTMTYEDESYEDLSDDDSPMQPSPEETRPHYFVGAPHIYVAPYHNGRYALALGVDRLRPTLLEEPQESDRSQPGPDAPVGWPEWLAPEEIYGLEQMYSPYPHLVLPHSGYGMPRTHRSSKRTVEEAERQPQPLPVTDEDEPGMEAVWPAAFGGELYRICLCPITGGVMRDPVVAADGHTYERAALMKWFRTCRRRQCQLTGLPNGTLTSPMTGETMGPNWFPNHSLRQLLSSVLDLHKKEKEKEKEKEREREREREKEKERRQTLPDVREKDKSRRDLPSRRGDENFEGRTPEPRPLSRSGSVVILPPLR